MRSVALSSFALGIALLSAPLLHADDVKAPAPEPEHFKLTFRLLQTGAEKRTATSHSYSMIVAAGGNSRPQSIRTGEKTPIQASGTEYQYQDVGTDIDTNNERFEDHKLSLRLDVACSSPVANPNGGNLLPIFRQTKWGSDVVVELDKPTIVFTSDNVSDTGRMELELTVTQVKSH